ncbi:MAG: MerR family transcriptional regulator [Propionibacteriaceae bacterium]|nr:MerR family transcriptional regulator [Propionibacteriaceae bacterium]
MEATPIMPLALSTQQAAARLGVSVHAIRYYERLGLVRVPRDARGHRVYDDAAIRRLTFVNRMRASGMGMAQLRRYIDLVEQGPATRPERLAVMLQHRETIRRQVAEFQAALEVTEHKISAYGGSLGEPRDEKETQ